MDTLEELKYFASTVYAIKKPEFLETMKAVSNRALSQVYPGNENNITVMSGNYFDAPEAQEFAQYVSQTAWNILSSQGYTAEQISTYFTEMWTQEHRKYSSMEHHIHGVGAQISAFYFLECPPDSCKIMLHDPRPGKVISTMYPADASKITDASTQILLTPEPGVLVLANSWLPHGFSRNLSDQPFRFIHMNLAVAMNIQSQCNVEVV